MNTKKQHEFVVFLKSGHIATNRKPEAIEVMMGKRREKGGGGANDDFTGS